MKKGTLIILCLMLWTSAMQAQNLYVQNSTSCDFWIETHEADIFCTSISTSQAYVSGSTTVLVYTLTPSNLLSFVDVFQSAGGVPPTRPGGGGCLNNTQVGYPGGIPPFITCFAGYGPAVSLPDLCGCGYGGAFTLDMQPVGTDYVLHIY